MYLSTYNLNFSFHLGFKVCGLTDVALMNLAGRAPPKLSRCSLTRPSFRLKLSLKLEYKYCSVYMQKSTKYRECFMFATGLGYKWLLSEDVVSECGKLSNTNENLMKKETF